MTNQNSTQNITSQNTHLTFASAEEKEREKLTACLRDCFLNSHPPVDITNKSLAKNSINPSDHKITNQKFDEICAKHGFDPLKHLWIVVGRFPTVEG